MRYSTRGRSLKIIVISIVTILFLIGAVVGAVFIAKGKSNVGGKFDISSVAIKHENSVVESLDVEVFSKDIQFDVLINDGESINYKDKPQVTWEIIGDCLNCLVDENGLVQIGNVLGTITLSCTVESENKITITLPISITKKAGSTLQTLSATLNDGYSTNYVEGQYFDKKSITLIGDFGDYSALISNFDIGAQQLQTSMTEMSITYEDKLFILPISVSHKTLQEIEIITQPNKTNYVEGQTFDKSGIRIKAIFNQGEEETESCYTDNLSALTTDDKEIEIFFEYDGIIKSAKQKISVSRRKLLSLTLGTQNIRKIYTQGERFDATGLKVFANFEELGSIEIFDYVVEDKPLMFDDKILTIEFCEYGVTKVAQIKDLVVLRPYEEIREIKVNSPSDVTLSWTYTYFDDEKNEQIDNLAYEENNLVYDMKQGIYEVPVGAVVTISAINPAVVDFLFDGVSQNMEYPTMTKIWKIESGQTMIIETVQMAGERISISFVGDNKIKNFIYSKTWNSSLRSQDLQKLFLVFKDSESYYYSFKIDDTTYLSDELATVSFNKNTLVFVEKNQFESNLVTLNLDYGDDLIISVLIDPQEYKFSRLPHPTKAGFAFEGWKYENGTQVEETNFKAFLQSTQSVHQIYAIWTKEVIDYSGQVVVGTWRCQETIDGKTVECVVEFKQDATFSYRVMVDGQENNYFVGSYRIEEDYISIISVETSGDYLLVSTNDFEFEKNENKLFSSIFVIDGFSLIKTYADMLKE